MRESQILPLETAKCGRVTSDCDFGEV